MKRKFILLPITLTALAPTVGLVGCGNPDKPTPPEPPGPEFELIEIINNSTTDINVYSGHYYKFYNDSFNLDFESPLFWLDGKGGEEHTVINVDLIKIEINNIETRNYTIDTNLYWSVVFHPEKNKSYAIYIKANETRINWEAGIGI